MHEINGMKITIRQPELEVTTVRRRWKERLFSLPWQPLAATKDIHHPEAATRNRQIWHIGGKAIMTPAVADAVRREFGTGRNFSVSH